MANKSNTYRKRRAARPRKTKIETKVLGAMLAVAILALFSTAALAGWDEPKKYDAVETVSLLRAELPDETPEIIKEYTGFIVSFNPSHRQPNYVAWELTGEEADGTLPRQNKFRPDPDVLGSPTLDDYRNSGYDRGHMAPAGDMKWSRQAMIDSHYLTNICPQTHQLNGGRWATLETKCREWARRDSAIIIITGPVLSDELSKTIGRGITVPDRFFKVLLSPYSTPPRAIGFIMPNNPPFDGLESMAVPVDAIEEITGIDFFKALPDELEEQIESRAVYRDWNRRKR